MNVTSNISLVAQDSKISTVQKVWYGIFTLESFLILTLNSVALSIFFKKNFLKKKSTFLLINLTFADLLVGLTIPVTFAVDFVDDVNVELVFYLPSLLAAYESLLSLAAIALERLFAIFWPFKHRLLKRSHYFWHIALSWFIASVISVFLLEQTTGHHWWSELVHHSSYLNYFQISLILILTALIVSSYIAIWVKVKFYQRFSSQRSEQENKKMAKTFSIVTTIFLITWWPVIIFEKFDNFGTDQSLEYIMYCLMYSNSFLNCIVYSVRMPEFRNELLVLLRKAKKVVCFGSRHPVHIANAGGSSKVETISRQVELKSVRPKNLPELKDGN